MAVASSQKDTIAAISTPAGEGGIGIVRISGSSALSIAARIFSSSRGRDILSSSQAIYHGHILDEQGNEIDEVLLHVMHAPHTYTREDVVEINCHGGMTPVYATLERVLSAGARLAHPGEFTRRAFMNGRIDLTQAESVIDRIRAQNRAGLQAASATATGALSKEIHALQKVLVEALAHIEAAVDFPEEDLPDLVDDALRHDLESVLTHVRELLRTADAGRVLREGASIAIAGRPNVGKSSLFNALLRDDRAIVTAHAGTTRDRLEETASIQGIPVRLIDTAGLRTTQDTVEQIGVEIARTAIQNADIILLVLDQSEPIAPEDTAIIQDLNALETPVWVALNKSDKPPQFDSNPAGRFAGFSNISAATGTGLAEMEQQLAALLYGGAVPSPNQCLITRLHQKDSLRRAEQALTALLGAFHASPELLSIDLQDAVKALGEITGETTPDDLLDIIFDSFCIGK